MYKAIGMFADCSSAANQPILIGPRPPSLGAFTPSAMVAWKQPNNTTGARLASAACSHTTPGATVQHVFLNV